MVRLVLKSYAARTGENGDEQVVTASFEPGNSILDELQAHLAHELAMAEIERIAGIPSR